MMSYDEFLQVLDEKLMKYKPQKLSGVQLEKKKVYEDGRLCDVLELKKTRMNARILVKEIYIAYLECGSMERTFRDLWGKIEEAIAVTNGLNSMDITGDAEKRVVVTLMNAEKSRRFLNQKDVPYRSFLDLAIVCRIFVKKDGETYAVTVNHDVMKKILHMDEDEMFSRAFKNTRKLYGVKVTDIRSEIYRLAGINTEGLKDLEDEQMYIITNEIEQYGAAVMLMEDELHRLATRLNKNLYILPSSVHEVLALPWR